MRTLLTIVATFILTTLFWFSVPTVRNIIANNHNEDVSPEPEAAHEDTIQFVAEDPRISDYEQQIKSYEKKIKNLESCRFTINK